MMDLVQDIKAALIAYDRASPVGNLLFGTPQAPDSEIASAIDAMYLAKAKFIAEAIDDEIRSNMHEYAADAIRDHEERQ